MSPISFTQVERGRGPCTTTALKRNPSTKEPNARIIKDQTAAITLINNKATTTTAPNHSNINAATASFLFIYLQVKIVIFSNHHHSILFYHHSI
jgi:hypothetical protein